MKRTALVSGAEEQTARAISAYAQYACIISLQMESIGKDRVHVGLRGRLAVTTAQSDPRKYVLAQQRFLLNPTCSARLLY